MAKTYIGDSNLIILLQLLSTELNKYVEKVSGKGLSTEDFTSALKQKLDGIDLSKYSTTEQMQSAINSAVSAVTGISFSKVESLPGTGTAGTIYLVSNSGSGQNVYDEYFWDATRNKFELFGTTAADLSGYLRTTDVVAMEESDIEAIWSSVFTS